MSRPSQWVVRRLRRAGATLSYYNTCAYEQMSVPPTRSSSRAKLRWQRLWPHSKCSRDDALAAKTLRRCAPATTEDAGARDCLVIFRQGLDELHLPSVADPDLTDLRASLQHEITCVAAPNEDDPTAWLGGRLPPGGPTDPAAAEQLDARTAEDLYRRMPETDRAILVDIGLVPSPTP